MHIIRTFSENLRLRLLSYSKFNLSPSRSMWFWWVESNADPFPRRVFTKFAIILTSVFINPRVFKAVSSPLWFAFWKGRTKREIRPSFCKHIWYCDLAPVFLGNPAPSWTHHMAGFRLFPLPIVPRALAIFRLLLFLLGYPGGASAEERAYSLRYFQSLGWRQDGVTILICILPLT